jgi:hypothetical protein
VAVADKDRESNVDRTLLEGGLSYKSELCYRSYVFFSSPRSASPSFSPASSTHPQNPSPPIAGLLSFGWSKKLPQLVLVDCLLSLPSDTFNFASFGSLNKVIRNETVQNAPAAIVGSTWNCLEVFEVCAKGATS